jgi:hypothetical protein
MEKIQFKYMTGPEFKRVQICNPKPLTAKNMKPILTALNEFSDFCVSMFHGAIGENDGNIKPTNYLEALFAKDLEMKLMTSEQFEKYYLLLAKAFATITEVEQKVERKQINEGIETLLGDDKCINDDFWQSQDLEFMRSAVESFRLGSKIRPIEN